MDGFNCRPRWPVIRFAGLSGYNPLPAGIPVRDVRGTKKRSAVVCASLGNKTCQFAGILQRIHGSDGTRTRDLRRDRPVMALAG